MMMCNIIGCERVASFDIVQVASLAMTRIAVMIARIVSHCLATPLSLLYVTVRYSVDRMAQAPIRNPPPAVKRICDRTAQFVATSGTAYETQILEQEEGNDKFSFLLPTSPFRPYYEFRLEQAKRALVKDAPSEELVLSSEARQLKETLEAAVTTQQEMEAAAAAAFHVPKPPDNLFLLTEKTPVLTTKDLDVIKHTALFVARHGRDFVDSLVAREAANPLFGFLRKTHSLHRVYIQYIDQYKRVLHPDPTMLAKLAKYRTSKRAVVHAAEEKFKYLRYSRTKAKREAQDAAASGKRASQLGGAAARIDWHDFVVVATVSHTDIDPDAHDSSSQAPVVLASSSGTRGKPRSAHAAAIPSLASAKANPALPAGFVDGAVESDDSDNDDVDMDMSMSDDDDDDDDGGDDTTTTTTTTTTGTTATPPVVAAPPPAGIKIVKEYKPRVVSASQRASSAKTTLCELCGRSIPLDQFEEHRRIEMLDPKWAKLKKQEEAARKNSALVEGTAAAATLKKMAQNIFASESEKGNDQAKVPGPVIWDGSVESSKLVKAAARKRAADPSVVAARKADLAARNRIDETIGPQPGPASSSTTATATATTAGIQQRGPPGPPAPPRHPNPRPIIPNLSHSHHPGMHHHPGGAHRAPPPYMGQGYGNRMMANMHGGLPGSNTMHGGLPPPPSNLRHGGGPGGPVGPPAKRQKVSATRTKGQHGPPRPAAPSVAAPSVTAAPSGSLMDEKAFLARAGSTKVRVTVVVPNDPSRAEYNFNGQTLSLDLDLRDSVSDLRPGVSGALNGMPSSKMSFATSSVPSLSNNKSLAYYNISSSTPVYLSFKGRGKRKR